MKILMFTDFVCEWCYLAKKIIESLNNDKIDLQYEFIEIHTDTSEIAIPMTEHIKYPNKFFIILNNISKKYSFEFCNKSLFVNTHKALILREHAKKLGKLNSFDRVIWDSYHLEGKDISDENTLFELLTPIGYSPSEVIKALSKPSYHEHVYYKTEYWQKNGIKQVPSFIINDKYLIHGVLEKIAWIDLLDKLETKKT